MKVALWRMKPKKSASGFKEITQMFLTLCDFWAHWACSLETCAADFPNIIGPNGSNSDSKMSHFTQKHLFVLQPLLFQWLCVEKNAFWVSVHYVMDPEAVITWFYMVWPLCHIGFNVQRCSWGVGPNALRCWKGCVNRVFSVISRCTNLT